MEETVEPLNYGLPLLLILEPVISLFSSSPLCLACELVQKSLGQTLVTRAAQQAFIYNLAHSDGIIWRRPSS